MNELLKALTELAIEGREFLAWKRSGVAGQVELPLGAGSEAAAAVDTSKTALEAPPKARKPRAPKVEAPAETAAASAPAAAPSNPNDDILGPSVGAGKPAAAAEMTEDESAKAATARAKTLMQRFDKIPAGQPAGQEKPEGYLIAKKIMADHFRVARIADMVHAQRLQFIVLVDAVLAERK